VPYDVIRCERDPKTLLAPPAPIAVHLLGKWPVITDEGITVAESAPLLITWWTSGGRWALVQGGPYVHAGYTH
jgi:glutathione S-transferase